MTATVEAEAGSAPALQIGNLVVRFTDARNRTVHAVNDVSLTVFEGETVGLVGESGCGKSTIAKAIMGLAPVSAGSIEVFGTPLVGMKRAQRVAYRKSCQMVFQDPISSLNPTRRVRKIVAEGLEIIGELDKSEIDAKVDEMLIAVGIDAEHAGERRAHEFSGGQCQRISIARALAVEPRILVCDEPVSALDVSVQAQILNILQKLKRELNLTMLFIAHDLAVIKNVSDRVVVMHLGALCEIAIPDELFSRPLHPYTAGLIASIPRPHPDFELDREFSMGEIPSPTDIPSGCSFRTRCPRARARCAEDVPDLVAKRPGHYVACHFPLEDE